jgi:dTDP-D-glucose 4,6-dehydratase
LTPIIITRCNNAISRYQYPDKLIPKTIKHLKEGERVPIHGDGRSRRTFIHATDIAKALEIIVQKGSTGEIYNIGTEMEYTVLQVVEHILNRLKPGQPFKDWVQFVEDRKFQDYRYNIDTTKLKALGWKETIMFDRAIDDLLL